MFCYMFCYTKMRGTMRGHNEGSIYKESSSGLWACAVTLPPGPDGKPRRKVVRSKQRATVVTKLRELKAQLAEAGDLPTQSWRADKWFMHWLDDIAPRMKTRPKTLAGYRSGLTLYAIPELGRLRLEQITPAHIRKVHDRVTGTPKPKALRNLPPEEWHEGTEMLSSTYALNVHNAMSAALKTATAENLIRSNPCDKAGRPGVRDAQQKALTVAQAVDLLAYCATIPDGPLWASYLLTGARRGELLGLERDRVGDVLDLSWQLQRVANMERDASPDYEYRHLEKSLYLTRPKSSKSWRVIPLVEPLRSIMALALQQARGDLVFTEDGKPYYDPDNATDRWKEVLGGAGLPDDVVLHGSRHTTVDLLYAAKVPEDLIMDIVGHSTRSVTRGYRSRADLARLTAAMEQMSAQLER
jgi:integrase